MKSQEKNNHKAIAHNTWNLLCGVRLKQFYWASDSLLRQVTRKKFRKTAEKNIFTFDERPI